MNERKMQIRVGIFVIFACVIAAIMVFHFGDFSAIWEPRYSIAVHFEEAPGVFPSTPVRQNGIVIGKVSEIVLDQNYGGVLVLVEIRKQFQLRKDTRPQLTLTLLGDATIDFSPGKNQEYLAPGDRLKGEPPSDPLQIVNQLDRKLNSTLDSFQATSKEWQQVGHNINGLLDTNRGNLDLVVERTAEALDQFTATMKNANETFV